MESLNSSSRTMKSVTSILTLDDQVKRGRNFRTMQADEEQGPKILIFTGCPCYTPSNHSRYFQLPQVGEGLDQVQKEPHLEYKIYGKLCS